MYLFILDDAQQNRGERGILYHCGLPPVAVDCLLLRKQVVLHHMEKIFAWGNHCPIPNPPAPPERNSIDRIPAQLLDELRKKLGEDG